MADAGKIRLWLDCDPGHDDACAILLAAYHPSLELLGVSTVHGNAPLSRTTVNALSVLEAIGKPEISVVAGAASPFCRPAKSAPDIHGESGLAGTNLLPEKPRRKALAHCNAITEMKDALVMQPKHTAWLVATGPLTNIALLFATFPTVAEHIAGLSIMGGAIGSGFTDVSMGRRNREDPDNNYNRFGNSTAFAEFNIYADPESARSIFQNPVLRLKTTLIPLDVTHQAYATPQIQQMLLYGARGPTKMRAMFKELLTFFADTYRHEFGLNQGPPLHDPLAVAALLSLLVDTDARIDFDDRNGERWDVDVMLQGEETGRTVATRSKDGTGVRIPRTLDLDKFWRTLDECMARADEATGFAS